MSGNFDLPGFNIDCCLQNISTSIIRGQPKLGEFSLQQSGQKAIIFMVDSIVKKCIPINVRA